jgi:TatD DNase family protein
MPLIDSHAHLDSRQFDGDREAVIARAHQAGLVAIVNAGANLESSRAAVALADRHDLIYATVGIHPHDAKTLTPAALAELRALASHPKVVAIGEIGLDYYWEAAPHDHQQRVFRAQLDLAAELELPVVIHLREKDNAADGPCFEDAMSILEGWVAGLGADKEALRKNPGVLHSFSGSLPTAQRAIGLNFCIGVTGPVTFKNAQQKQEMVAQLPLEYLLIETDAPYLAPHPHRGKRNEPAFVAEIADKIAQLQSRSREEVAVVTTNNAARLFSWGEVV